MKQRITFEETVKFQHEIEIEVENSAVSDAVDRILNKEYDCLESACYAISRTGVKIIGVQEDSDGQDSEMECIDVCDITELEERK